MKTSMLEYVKLILSKVSFDRKLFRKEYRKGLGWLSSNEAGELKSWLRAQRLRPAYIHRSSNISNNSLHLNGGSPIRTGDQLQ